MKVQAKFKGQIIAESENTKQLEGNHYFPVSDVKKEFLKTSDTETVCHWKGTASYYSIDVNGEIGSDAAWYYPEPKDAAKAIKDHIAFWRGVEVSEV
ncbi:DUF427 domain-containing protein [Cryomorphaceae bacterium 1068]|nr:DUF427 domain-containing protein [Cryomorphaceae bacterium 1068]